tara:strand:+ start:953 stop:2221 length:1269 start_codon:yes stop_codon:yes gene_type:complete
MLLFQRIILLLIFTATFPGLSAATLEMWISSHQDQIYYEKMAELYRQKSKKELTLNVHAYGFREMPDKLAVAFRTGKGMPDLVQLDETFFGVFLGKNPPFADLTDRLKQSGLAKDLHPRRIEVFTYEGKTLGIPQSLSAMVLYYRKDLFKEFGIKPADVETWEKFEKTGAKLMKDHGQRFMAIDGTHFDVLLRQKGHDLFDAKGKVLPKFDEAVDLLTWLGSLGERQIAVLPDRGTIFDPVFFSGDLETGEVLCVMGADWYGLDLFQQFAPDMKGLWGMLPLPAWTDKKGKLGPRTATFAGQGLMICKKSPHEKEAWDFIEFVMKDADANLERYKQGNSFPAYLPSWKDKRLLAKHEYFDQSMGKLLVELADEIPPIVVNPKRPQAIFLMQENYFGAVMFQALTAKDAMNQYLEALTAEDRR